MKIALIGYGKMGKAIEKIALQRGHEIVTRIDVDNQQDFDSAAFRGADVAIEFTSPKTAVENYRKCFERGVKVVSGSTGWTSVMAEVEAMCAAAGGTFLWSSNFSIGVNLFFALNSYLAKLMNGFPQYAPHITETHHIHKLDHPSGTAISIAEGIIDGCGRISGWSEDVSGTDTIVIDHIRREEIPGIHQVNWDSAVDNITIEHHAKSREGFAFGAVLAAEFAAGRQGVLTMDMFMQHLISPAHKSNK